MLIEYLQFQIAPVPTSIDRIPIPVREDRFKTLINYDDECPSVAKWDNNAKSMSMVLSHNTIHTCEFIHFSVYQLT